jgi:soluble lytic murein transglycosylase-like protein
MDAGATANRLLDPNYNVDLGTQYMAKNLIRYGGDIKSAIAAYNSGTARTNEKGEYVNSQGKTNVQDYVDKVLRNYQMYTEWLGKGAKPFDVSVFDMSAVSPYLIGAFVIMTLIVLMRVKKPEVEYV